MTYSTHRVSGQPYPKGKVLGNVDGTATWSQAVVEQTQHLPRVAQACLLRVTFLLPANRFPTNYPFGPDLDNLLKLFLDALNQTIFADAPGKDSCIIALEVMKTRVPTDDEAGAQFEVLPINVT
jgi:Holliday junction resolvase RusA-like endonuclease